MRGSALSLKKATRDGDVCGRYEGDDFVYLVDKELEWESVAALCRDLSSELCFAADFESVSLNLSASIGAARHPEDGSTASEVIESARSALRRAKSAGQPFDAGCAAVSEHTKTELDPPVPEPDGAVAELDGPNRQVDRRKDRRHRVLKPGLICLPGSEAAIECTIRDISTGGARLRVGDYFAPPDRFVLSFVGTGDKRAVRTRWQIGKEIGVEFLPKGD